MLCRRLLQESFRNAFEKWTRGDPPFLGHLPPRGRVNWGAGQSTPKEPLLAITKVPNKEVIETGAGVCKDSSVLSELGQRSHFSWQM